MSTTTPAMPATRSGTDQAAGRAASPGAAAGGAGGRQEPGDGGWRAYAERVLLTALTFAEVMLVAAAVGLAGLLYGGYFAEQRYAAPVLGAAVLGSLVVCVAASRDWSAARTAVAAAGAFLLFATYAVLLPTTTFGVPTADTLRGLADGLRSGWARMLSVALPADASPDLLFLPVLLSWTAAASGTAAALRTRTPLLPLLPPVVVFVVALAFTAPRPRASLPLTVLFCAALLLLALLRANRAARQLEETAPELASSNARAVGLDVARQRWRATAARLAFGLPVLAGVLAVAMLTTVAMPLADGTDRFDPRSLREQPVTVTTSVTPLARIKPQLQNPTLPLFTVAVTGESGLVDRVRIAALDKFDGAVWSSEGSYLVSGSTLPETDEGRPAASSRVTLDIELSELPGPFLPVAGRPVRVAATGGDRLAVDPATGDLVGTDPQRGPSRYRVTADVPRVDDGLLVAQPSRSAADAAATALPDPPPWVAEVARARDTPNAYPYRRLRGLEEYLRSLGYDEGARPGHSYGAVFRLLVGEPAERVGYAEQFASAFVTTARAWGFPARVAVGYRLRPESLRDGRHAVTSGDAHAWPEVHLAGYGWVPFEPTNTGNAGSPTPPRPQVDLGRDPSTAPGVEGPSLPQDGLGGDEPAGGAGPLRSSLVVLGMVLGVVALLLLAVVAAKALRRRYRRSHGTPGKRILAAWAEVTDRLRERGVAVGPERTGHEIAASAEQRLGRKGATPAMGLAPLVTAALFAPQEPGEQAARQAWQLEAESRRRAGLRPAARLLAVLDPRPLMPRRWRDASDAVLARMRLRRSAVSGSAGVNS